MDEQHIARQAAKWRLQFIARASFSPDLEVVAAAVQHRTGSAVTHAFVDPQAEGRLRLVHGLRGALIAISRSWRKWCLDAGLDPENEANQPTTWGSLARNLAVGPRSA